MLPKRNLLGIVSVNPLISTPSKMEILELLQKWKFYKALFFVSSNFFSCGYVLILLKFKHL
jgi:hypothetical protein